MSGAFAGAGVGKPARGVEFRIDWLSLTFKGWSIDQVLAHLVPHFGEAWGDAGWEFTPIGEERMRGRGPHGSLIEENLRQDWTHLQIKGEACGVLGTGTLLDACAAARKQLGVRFAGRRVDVAWDDFEKRVGPADLRARVWSDRRHKQAGVRCKAVRSCERTNYGESLGGTFQLGSRQSGRVLRWYDKEEESKGKVRSMRCELETKDRFADALLAELITAGRPAAVVAAALGHLVAFLDFRDPADKTRRARWWADFVGDAEAARVGKARPASLAEFLKSHVRQSGGGFRVLCAAVGDPVRAAGVLLAKTPEPRNPRHRRYLRDIEAGTLGPEDQPYLSHLSSMPLSLGPRKSGARGSKASTPADPPDTETQPAGDPQGA
ncbi:MAG: replication initiation factor domain-containing protein [Planctomycetes bacterium]|nr:replication initiation factor domain-containing protein [Planctomycetota bacterium]